MQSSMRQRFADASIIPVMVIDDLNHAIPLAEALVEGGLDVLEITLRTPAALGAIEAIAKAVPSALVGVGTAINAEHVKQSVDAGASFVVSPGMSPAIIQACQARDTALLSGVANASDMMVALEHGLDFVKFFPAQTLGGAKAISAYAGPFPQLSFCPTGGVNASNANEYLGLSNVVCVGGSWVLDKAAIGSENWSAITKLCQTAKTAIAQNRSSS